MKVWYQSLYTETQAKPGNVKEHGKLCNRLLTRRKESISVLNTSDNFAGIYQQLPFMQQFLLFFFLVTSSLPIVWPIWPSYLKNMPTEKFFVSD